MVIAQDRHFASIFSFEEPNPALRALGGEDRKHRTIGAKSSLIEIDSAIRPQHNCPPPEGGSCNIPQLEKIWGCLAKDGRETPICAEQRFRLVFVGAR